VKVFDAWKCYGIRYSASTELPAHNQVVKYLYFYSAAGQTAMLDMPPSYTSE